MEELLYFDEMQNVNVNLLTIPAQIERRRSNFRLEFFVEDLLNKMLKTDRFY